MRDEREELAAVDLLDAEAPAVDLQAGRRALEFLWATGAGRDALDVALSPQASPSGFDASAFAEDLFLPELVRRCLPVSAEGRRRAVDLHRLTRIFALPPTDPAVVARRREVLGALTSSPDVLAAAERLYGRVADLRDRMVADNVVSDRGTERLRKLDALGALRAAIDALADLADAGGALGRLGATGRTARQGHAFLRLLELLDWESGASTVELSLRIGSDGEIRAVTTLARRDVPSPSREGVLARWWRRVQRLLRGERWDDEALVARLVDEIFAPLADVTLLLFRIALDLEPFLASLGMRALAIAEGLPICLPQLGAPDANVHFRGLWNPFLAVEAETHDAARPVTCDLSFEDGGAPLVVVTGPNSGGKTRLLQSVAIAVLLGQGGFFVPGSEAAWPWVPRLFASLAISPAHDAPEGRLGTELIRVREVFEQARPGCLVVLDELCAGTNPSEAEELVRFVVEQLAELGAFVLVTTHLLDVARHLQREPPAPRLHFYAVELDGEERPTFRFTTGVAASSLARRTAERLGVTREALAELVAARRAQAEARPAIPEALSKRTERGEPKAAGRI